MSFVHYKWLDKHLPDFLEAAGVLGGWDANAGIVTAHGDKFYGYRDAWEAAGLHFAHGCAIGLLTYCHPYSEECRETANGWVAPADWVVANKERFLGLLPQVNESNLEYCVAF